MLSGDFGKLNANDYNNLAFLGRTLIGANHIRKSVVKPSKTGTNKVEVKVKINGEDYTASYTASSRIPWFICTTTRAAPFFAQYSFKIEKRHTESAPPETPATITSPSSTI